MIPQTSITFYSVRYITTNQRITPIDYFELQNSYFLVNFVGRIIPTPPMKRFLQIFITLLVIYLASFPLHAEGSLQDLIASQREAVRENRLEDAIDFGKIALTAYRNGQTDTLIWCALDMGGNACVGAR